MFFGLAHLDGIPTNTPFYANISFLILLFVINYLSPFFMASFLLAIISKKHRHHSIRKKAPVETTALTQKIFTGYAMRKFGSGCFWTIRVGSSEGFAQWRQQLSGLTSHHPIDFTCRPFRRNFTPEAVLRSEWGRSRQFAIWLKPGATTAEVSALMERSVSLQRSYGGDHAFRLLRNKDDDECWTYLDAVVRAGKLNDRILHKRANALLRKKKEGLVGGLNQRKRETLWPTYFHCQIEVQKGKKDKAHRERYQKAFSAVYDQAMRELISEFALPPIPPQFSSLIERRR